MTRFLYALRQRQYTYRGLICLDTWCPCMGCQVRRPRISPQDLLDQLPWSTFVPGLVLQERVEGNKTRDSQALEALVSGSEGRVCSHEDNGVFRDSGQC